MYSIFELVLSLLFQLFVVVVVVVGGVFVEEVGVLVLLLNC